MFERFYTNSYLIYKFESNATFKLYNEIVRRNLNYTKTIPYEVYRKISNKDICEIMENKKLYELYKTNLTVDEILMMVTFDFKPILNDSDYKKLIISIINRDKTNSILTDVRVLEMCINHNINLKSLNKFNSIINNVETIGLKPISFCKLVKIYGVRKLSDKHISYMLHLSLELEDKKYTKFIYHTFKNQVGDFIKPLLKKEN